MPHVWKLAADTRPSGLGPSEPASGSPCAAASAAADEEGKPARSLRRRMLLATRRKLGPVAAAEAQGWGARGVEPEGELPPWAGRAYGRQGEGALSECLM
jgi:hypothetical protein